jgi:FdhD protein
MYRHAWRRPPGAPFDGRFGRFRGIGPTGCAIETFDWTGHRASAILPAVSFTSSALEFDVVRVDADVTQVIVDVAAAEEPLELRLGGQPFVVIMRTPNADRELATGFLLSEQIVMAPGDVAEMRYCTEVDGRDTANVLNIWLQGDATARAQRAISERRHVTANSACGVCGRRSIEDLLAGARAVHAQAEVKRTVIASLPDALRAAQLTFDRTGGLHAAGLFTTAGDLRRIAEDVGRHNAVDKVIGASLMANEVPLGDTVLFVSGRTSFEIVQKAVVAGIPIVASVSAPSSLAIELARDAGVTLIGFVRGAGFNIYTGRERVAL